MATYQAKHFETPCPAHNGTYYCTLPQGHTTHHLASRRGKFWWFVDNYSEMYPAKVNRHIPHRGI